MQATSAELDTLRVLQEVDRGLITGQKELDNLPQRRQLEALAQKKRSVLEKSEQIAKMLEGARRKATQIEDEISILGRKRAETQEKIDAAGGDFRAIQSLTRDLDGIAKRMATVEDEQVDAITRLEQVQGVKAQVDQALAALDAQALKTRDDYQRDARTILERQQELERRRSTLVTEISAPVLKAYETACKRGGGIGLAELSDNRCGACRSTLDANRLLIVKREAPLSTCPSCNRLLLV